MFFFEIADHVHKVYDWANNSTKDVEIPYKPARVVLQDFTGVPCVVDLASMRDIMKLLKQDPNKINPLIPTDLVIDHSVIAEHARSPDALRKNMELEFRQNHERFQFLKWGQKQFRNFSIVPPGSGIVHQVNLEHLARVVFNNNGLLYPDSCVGADSHTTMINGLGVVGWGVGGIEAESSMLGQAISMVLPEVVGVKLTGKLKNNVNATDLVLHVVQQLRKRGVVGKFVEFFGEGIQNLSLSDRATVSNMGPEYGATIGYFPVDAQTIEYLEQTGRTKEQTRIIESYLRTNSLFYDPSKEANYSGELMHINLSEIEPNLAGPKRPHDKVPLKEMKKDFHSCLTNKVGFKGYGLPQEQASKKMKLRFNNQDYDFGNGSVIISAITSCTNTSNPEVMLAAGVLAKNAVLKGLTVAPYIKTTLSPGSGAVTKYLESSGVQSYLEKLGYYTAGYGCMTCIGNSGELPNEVVEAITKNDIVAASVLSGNRNFEGRVHPQSRANYLASPPLCVAYALAGRVDIDWETEPIGKGNDGKDVYLRDIWPLREELQKLIKEHIKPAIFKETYEVVTKGTPEWNSLKIADSPIFDWDSKSTYIKQAPFFDTVISGERQSGPIKNARCLMYFGDSITTDHISPAGNIAKNSPAAKYLDERGVSPKDYNQYGTRRGNFEVMARGTFANTRIVNKLVDGVGPRTKHLPSGTEASVFEVAELYKKDKTPTIILAGKEYGSGSSRDWAAKGKKLFGVKAVIAESFERIHRSNLVGMGILPCEFIKGQTAESLGLTGKEVFSLHLGEKIGINELIDVTTDCHKKFQVKTRIDTDPEIEYYKDGGLLVYVLKNIIKA